MGGIGSTLHPWAWFDHLFTAVSAQIGLGSAKLELGSTMRGPARRRLGPVRPNPGSIRHQRVLGSSTPFGPIRPFLFPSNAQRRIRTRAQRAPDERCTSPLLRRVATILLSIEAVCLVVSRAKASHWHLRFAKLRQPVQVTPRAAIHFVAVVATSASACRPKLGEVRPNWDRCNHTMAPFGQCSARFGQNKAELNQNWVGNKLARIGPNHAVRWPISERPRATLG